MTRSLPHARLFSHFCLALGVLSCSGDGLSGQPESGTVDGYLCDPLNNSLAVGVKVSGEGLAGTVSTQTNGVGYFVLPGLKVGAQVLNVESAVYTDIVPVTVVASTTQRIPNPSCLNAAPSEVKGKICGFGDGVSGSTYWVTGARVYIVDGGDVYETYSVARGEYTLPSVPPGPRTLHVTKGSYSVSVDVLIPAGETVTLDPTCIGENVRVGVVTGIFDRMDTVLRGADMGLRVRDCVPDNDAYGCPPAAELTPGGALTMIDGTTSSYITDILMDPERLSEFKILFFDCGLTDAYLLGAPAAAKENLINFVQGGGSLYVSDYAYEVIRWAFPGTLNFWGDDGVPNSAKVGLVDSNLLANVVDSDLTSSLGTDRVALVYSKGNWVVLDNQQTSDLRVWVRANVQINNLGVATDLNDSPLLVGTDVGLGRILFTSFHIGGDASTSNAEMADVLRYIVFEL